ncbi:MAG TPA: hypothetical protein DC042_07025 [Bacteroidales bacterium]|nr:hypothetical protein [Bacteroidales bacterium]
MKSFLSLVAEDLFRITQGNFKDYTIVFPNRRAGGLFRNELLKLTKKPIWAPSIFSIDDWIVSLSGIREADPLTQLACLYKVVSKQMPQIESFASFIDFGDILLTDFDDVDKYLVKPELVFHALKELKNIDEFYNLAEDEDLRERIRTFWSSFGREPSDHQKQWLSIWDNLFQIYSDFHSDLEASGMGTSGMCYRKVSQLISKEQNAVEFIGTSVFVGFNILTKSEELIFTGLKDCGKALFYWDYHPFYLGRHHEAGRFISKYLDQFSPPSSFKPYSEERPDFYSDYGVDSGRLRIMPLTSGTGQVQTLVSDIGNSGGLPTLIVLSDESLLPDLISAWNPGSGEVNFTSGFPLATTRAASFFRNYLAMSEGVSDLGFSNELDRNLISDFSRDPWFKLIGLSEPGFSGLFDTRVMPTDRLAHLRDKLNAIVNELEPLEKAALKLISGQIDRINALKLSTGLDINSKGLRKLLDRFSRSTKITLQSDHQAINQVSGILETRLLDFERIYILSFNEGIWPSKGLPGSLIPYSLRRYFGLPTAENRDAMYAYYFYRLIQRAGTVTLFYTTGQMDEVIRSGEKSRYISQLEFDSPIPVTVLQEKAAVIATRKTPISINKSGVVQSELMEYVNAGSGRKLSASALNDFLDCSLRFAFKYIYNWREPDDSGTPSEPKGFGQLLHRALEQLYKTFAESSTAPDSQWYKVLLSKTQQIDALLQDVYTDLLQKPGFMADPGKDQLALIVAREFLVETLRNDSLNAPDKIIGIEKVIEMSLPQQLNGELFHVNFKAVIDRIDIVGSGIRIIDYKTGSCELSFSAVEDLFNGAKTQRRKEIFQVLLYSELFLRSTDFSGTIQPSLFRFIRLRAGDPETRIRFDKMPLEFNLIREEFNAFISQLFNDLFNADLPFSQTANESLCKNCSFSLVCGRS